MTYAIEPKTRADEDKLAPALHKLMEEDLLVRFFRDRGDQRISGRRRGSAAHRSDCFAAEEAVPHRGDAEGAEGAVSRDDSGQGRSTWAA